MDWSTGTISYSAFSARLSLDDPLSPKFSISIAASRAAAVLDLSPCERQSRIRYKNRLSGQPREGPVLWTASDRETRLFIIVPEGR